MRATAARDGGAVFRILTGLFLRRLLDNDTLSPHADRHESLAVLYGLIVSLAVFATFFMCVDYLAAFVQLPGPAALSALSDRFLFIAGSITISALGALMVWDALALEPRDAAILGPLPIAARTIARAKLAAALLFGAAIAVSLNAVPSVLYPSLLTINIRGIRAATLLLLMAVHAVTVMLAGLTGFCAVLAVRGTLRLVLTEPTFRRIANAAQSALVVAMIAALLLAPTVRPRNLREWVAQGTGRTWVAEPALWFLALNESLAGHRLSETPVVLPPRFTTTGFRADEDRTARAEYRSLLPRFATTSRRAWLASLLAVGTALTTFLWTNRRLPDRAGDLPALPGSRARLRRIVERVTRRNPEMEAAFFFALQTIARSAPHRTIVSIGLAVGATHALVVLARIARPAPLAPATPIGWFALATGLLIALLAAFRYAATVPAAPAANWSIRLAYRGNERPYFSGVKWAALSCVGLTLVLLLPLHVVLLGTTVAFVHSGFELLFAMAALELLFLSSRKLPFACTYVPIQNPKVVWPAGLLGLLVVSYGFATAERWATESAMHAAAWGLTLGTTVLLLQRFDRRRRTGSRPTIFDERPALPTQRLGLSDHVMGSD